MVIRSTIEPCLIDCPCNALCTNEKEKKKKTYSMLHIDHLLIKYKYVYIYVDIIFP